MRKSWQYILKYFLKTVRIIWCLNCVILTILEVINCSVKIKNYYLHVKLKQEVLCRYSTTMKVNIEIMWIMYARNVVVNLINRREN